jgi:two-component system, chemotaxis family, sensor kinase CheA
VMTDLHQGLGEGVDQLDRELQQVRDSAERLRLVPLATVFRPLEHAARDVARAQGKQMAFTGRGGDLRFDAHLIGTVQAALEQLVRNAVAHGIEAPDDRQRAGKPAAGQVSVDVARRGQRAVFTCRDDGRGIDVAAVVGAARARGLVPTPDDDLGPDAALRLLLAGGISTSGVVTEVSGRGIGLDIVRDAVERLDGRITAHTTPGQGTTIEIDVPLALSSLQALTVEAGGLSAILPIEAVRRIVRVRTDELASTGRGESFVYEGTAVPFVPLSVLMTGAPTPAPAGGAWSAVVLETDGGLAAVGVHRLTARASVVVRPLPELVPTSAIVSGVSLDSHGDAQLVLDPRGVVEAAGRAADALALALDVEREPILIVDDSLTTRMLEQTILESAGYEVDLAVSGEDALEKAGQRRYALFLVDIEMPGMDGFTFVEHVRSSATLRDTPCIFVTSRATPEDRLRGANLGARAYIIKNQFDQHELLGHIREVVGG